MMVFKLLLLQLNPTAADCAGLLYQEARSKPQEGHRVDILREKAHRNVIGIRAV